MNKHLFYGNCLQKFAFKIFCIFNICLILSRRAHVFVWNSALVYRPFLNSQGWTGSSMKWRLMRANLFKCKLICPHWPPFHARSSPAVRIQQWSILIKKNTRLKIASSVKMPLHSIGVVGSFIYVSDRNADRSSIYRPE